MKGLIGLLAIAVTLTSDLASAQYIVSAPEPRSTPTKPVAPSNFLYVKCEASTLESTDKEIIQVIEQGTRLPYGMTYYNRDAMVQEAKLQYERMGVRTKYVSCSAFNTKEEMDHYFRVSQGSGRTCYKNGCVSWRTVTFPSGWADRVPRLPASPLAGKGGYPTSSSSPSVTKVQAPPPPSPRDIAIDKEVARLGNHRRAEAERLVDMRLKAEEARGRQVPASNAVISKSPPAPQIAPSGPKPNSQDEVLAWKEGVVLCSKPSIGTAVSTCRGPLQTVDGTIGKPSGTLALNQACGVKSGVRELGSAGQYLAYGCGYGTHPEDAKGQYPGNRDVPALLGISFVGGRDIFHCKRRISAYCRTK